MSVDFWVETASPIKNPIKDAFLEYSKKIYEEQGYFLSSYFPSAMGGDMPVQDYLINMNIEDAPENYLTMGFSECSSLKFYEKYIKSGVYNYSRIVAWFPEAMVIDLKRLGSRPVPKDYSDLCLPCYKDEVCIIGSPRIPDPLAALYIFKEKGEAATEQFIANIAGFGAPVNAIRHIGKSSNSFGSVFIMPLLFADICGEIKNVLVVRPSDGYFAEPYVLFSKSADSRALSHINNFIESEGFIKTFEDKKFYPAISENDFHIKQICKQSYFLELKEIYPLLQEHLKMK